MSENKVNIYTILDPAYAEVHDIIMNSLENDAKTLYSCIRVNRAFCKIFVSTLWKNPFKFVKKDDNLIEIFNTLIHCLDPSKKNHLINRELIRIKDLPTPRAYFNYHTFIKEFELNPLQKGMRLWTSTYLSRSDDRFGGKKVSRRVIKLNRHIGDLLFGNENRYDSLSIHYNDLLSGPSSLFDICTFNNHEKSLVNVNKLSLGFYHKNSTELISHITRKFLKLQNALSTNIQHLQIFIETTKGYSEISKNLINFIQSQQNLKSLLIHSSIFKDIEFNHFLNALQIQSKSLTFLSLQKFLIVSAKLLSMLKSLPNLITFEIDQICIHPDSDDISREVSTLLFKNLEHLYYNPEIDIIYHLQLLNHRLLLTTHHQMDPREQLFKQILSSSNNLKSLKVKENYCRLIIEVQQQTPLNLTHLHLVMVSRPFNSSYSFDNLYNLITLVKNLHQLVHLKLTEQDRTNQVIARDILNTDDLFKEFSQALARSLKILEVNFIISDKHLEILLNESQFNIQCVRLYGHNNYEDTALRIFIDYAKKKKCFKELGIPRITNFSEKYVKEANDHFNLTVVNKINDLFYELPINNSFWANFCSNRKF